jgi:hypothetical protein
MLVRGTAYAADTALKLNRSLGASNIEALEPEDNLKKELCN